MANGEQFKTIKEEALLGPGMAGTVPELMSGVPCPGMGHFCPGIY